jgi:Skp family chaperone for outer membrane proteins
MTRALPIVLILAALCAAPRASAQDSRVCTVDLQEALGQVREGRNTLASLTSDLERRQRELDAAQQELAQWMQDLETQIAVLSAEQRQARLEEYEQRVADLQRSYAASQQELSRAEGEATQRIYERMVGIVRELAQQQSCGLVLQESAVVFAASSVDLTTPLVTAYDARY